MSLNLKSAGKFLALILRHNPGAIGITLDAHGWASVCEVIAGIQRARPSSSFNMEILEQIVATDNKQRFIFNHDKSLIRANQGHSVNVDVDLEKKIPPDELWHGTGEKYVSSIECKGLIPGSRLYVHLSSDYNTALKVGARHGTPIVYRVNTKQMSQDGYEFYLSVNGVWLTKFVPYKYLQLQSGE